jgi:Ran GTPase-activating protein (RanGAP) involved in mRNA processing and transport
LLAADGFVAALGALPPDDWKRTWAAGRTIMMRRTSKRVKEVVDKMRLPAVVRLIRSFWDDARNGAEKEKCRFVLRQLTGMSGLCRITTLELRSCAITGPHAEWLAGGVLAQCRALVHLDLSGNDIGGPGAERLVISLPQCTALAQLDLSYNRIGPDGAESLAGVLGQCSALAHLNLSENQIGSAGSESLGREACRSACLGRVLVLAGVHILKMFPCLSSLLSHGTRKIISVPSL